MTASNDIDALAAMLLVRELESALSAREDCGFQLLSSGQEAVAVGVAAALLAQDQLLCSGRSIAPALARGLDPGRVMAELIGRASGPCLGRGGRGHLSQPSAGFFGAHAVVAGNLSIAAGVALALQARLDRSIAVCLFGDGACGAGALHETMNIAALWQLPLLLVCDNNLYSVSTPRAAALAPQRLSDLAAPFGIKACTVDGIDRPCSQRWRPCVPGMCFTPVRFAFDFGARDAGTAGAGRGSRTGSNHTAREGPAVGGRIKHANRAGAARAGTGQGNGCLRVCRGVPVACARRGIR